MTLSGLLILLALGGAASWALTSSMRRYALHAGLFDLPNARSSHTVATPRGGGVAIVVSFLAIGRRPARFRRDRRAPRRRAPRQRPRRRHPRLHRRPPAAAGALALSRPPARRRLGALLARTAAEGAALRRRRRPRRRRDAALGALPRLVDQPVQLHGRHRRHRQPRGDRAWRSAAPSSGGWPSRRATGPSRSRSPPASPASWSGISRRARIFMGDAGSGFLGCMVATLALWSSHTAAHLFWSWFILGGCFMVDATVTLVRRVARGERFNVAHRSHAYQYAARRYRLAQDRLASPSSRSRRCGSSRSPSRSPLGRLDGLTGRRDRLRAAARRWRSASRPAPRPNRKSEHDALDASTGGPPGGPARRAPRSAIMIGGDAVFLPLCMLLAVAFRLGSLEAAVHTAPLIQIARRLARLARARHRRPLPNRRPLHRPARPRRVERGAGRRRPGLQRPRLDDRRSSSCRARRCRSSGSSPSPTSSPRASSPAPCFGAA